MEKISSNQQIEDDTTRATAHLPGSLPFCGLLHLLLAPSETFPALSYFSGFTLFVKRLIYEQSLDGDAETNG
jgi:hypothetical protein